MKVTRSVLTVVFLLFALNTTMAQKGAAPSAAPRCGAVVLEGDPTGKTDSGPALTAALEDLARCGGGTLEVGHGQYKLETGVVKDFQNLTSKITIRGQGSNSQIIFATGPGVDGLLLQNLEDLRIDGITFVGSPNLLPDGSPNPAAGGDVFRALHLTGILRVKITHNIFYGIAAPAPGAAIIKATNSYLTVEGNQFLGSAACQSGNAYGGVIMTDSHIGVRINHNSFIDYGTLNGVYYSKTPLVWTFAWVVLMNPNSAVPIDSRSNNPVEISYNQFDEGAMYAVVNNPDNGPAVTQHMVLAYNTMNIGLVGGYYLRRIKHLDITGGWAGYRPLDAEHGEVDAITLRGVEFPTIQKFETDSKKSATRLSVDSGTAILRIVDSKFTTILNQAKAWRIENGTTINSGPAEKTLPQ